MASILGHVDVQAVLQTSVVPQASFGVELLLSADDQVPLDQRFFLTAESSYDTDFTAATDPYIFGGVYFGQKRVASSLMIGRWAQAATSPYFACGLAVETDYLVWKAISDGSFTVRDNTAVTPLEDDVSGCDFSAITDISGVKTVLDIKMAATVPNISGLDTSVFTWDILGRLTLTNSTTGASAKTITIIPTVIPIGTDLAAGLMDYTNGVTQAGLDAEDPSVALAAISAKSAVGDSYYNVALDRLATDDQMVSTAAYIEGKTKLLDLVITDADAIASGTSTDVGSRCLALSYQRTMCLYTQQTTEWPDAATAGAVLPATEGSTSWAFEALASVSQSGLAAPLSETSKTTLQAKNYNYIETVGAITYLYDGITSGDVEKRIMLGRDWFEDAIAAALFTDLLNQPLRGFTNSTIANSVALVKQYGNEAIERGIGVDTVDRPFEVNPPDADDFTTSERASHLMELGSTSDPFFVLHLNSAVNDYTIIGVWNI